MTIKDFAQSAKDLSRNPLGMIGLFLVLVYGFACLVTASSFLDVGDKRILVYFIIVFPCVVLFVFYKLVTDHHNKLYSPADFSNEDNFMRALEVGLKKSETINDIEEITKQIQKQINEQPIYRYTKLKEEGKLIILIAKSGDQLLLTKFAEARNLDYQTLKEQANLLVSSYGWIVLDNDEVKITQKGIFELETFEDLVYGRMK